MLPGALDALGSATRFPVQTSACRLPSLLEPASGQWTQCRCWIEPGRVWCWWCAAVQCFNGQTRSGWGETKCSSTNSPRGEVRQLNSRTQQTGWGARPSAVKAALVFFCPWLARCRADDDLVLRGTDRWRKLQGTAFLGGWWMARISRGLGEKIGDLARLWFVW